MSWTVTLTNLCLDLEERGLPSSYELLLGCDAFNSLILELGAKICYTPDGAILLSSRDGTVTIHSSARAVVTSKKRATFP